MSDLSTQRRRPNGNVRANGETSTTRSRLDYTDAEMLAALRMVLQPTKWFNRAVESVEISDRVIRRKITLDITLPRLDHGSDDTEIPVSEARTASPEGLRYLIPLLNVHKGYRIDNLDVCDEAGHSLSVLTRTAHNDFTAELLNTYVDHLFARLDEDDVRGGCASEYLQRLRDKCEDLVRGLAHAPPWDAVAMVNELTEPPAPPSPEHRAAETIAPNPLRVLERGHRFIVLLRRLAAEYFLLAQLNGRPGEHRVVKLSLDADHIPLFRTRNVAHRMTRTLVEIGLQQPPAFAGPASRLDNADSYHFKMAAPPGHRIEEQNLVRGVVEEKNEKERQGNEQREKQRKEVRSKSGLVKILPPDRYPYHDINRLGSKSAHIYVRMDDLAERYADDPHLLDKVGVEVSFYPEPWGLVGQSTIVGLAAATLLFWLAWRLESVLQSELRAAMAAAMLSLPAALSAILLNWSPLGPRHLVFAPFRSRLLAFVTAVSVFIVAGMLVFLRFDVEPSSQSRPAPNSTKPSAPQSSESQRAETSWPFRGGGALASGLAGTVSSRLGGAQHVDAHISTDADGRSQHAGSPVAAVRTGQRTVVGIAIMLVLLASLNLLALIKSLRNTVRALRMRASAIHGEDVPPPPRRP